MDGAAGEVERRAARRRASAVEVEAAFGRVRDALAGSVSDAPGHRRVLRGPLGARYVVLSDHHLTHRGHRQDFFGRNLVSYVQVLRAYHRAGFTVVENGDVEELVIFDPDLEPGEIERRAPLSLDELKERRVEVRRRQLDRILHDERQQPLLEAWRALSADGRLVRTAGNHDYDLQDDALWAQLKAELPDLERPWDYLVLEEPGRPPFVILHGHQFDLATNPVAAPTTGELVSECLSLFYQGADRNWRWTDGPADWSRGATPYPNRLARKRSDKRLDLAAADAGLELSADRVDFEADPERASDETRAVVDSGLASAVFERLFEHTIAWEYFHHGDHPARAVLDEVMSGDRFFKFRHLDETELVERWRTTFPTEATRPSLVLGHSHELRYQPLVPDASERASEYFNAGSVGRFENLLFGIELVDGRATAVSWSSAPPPDGPLERRRWSLDEDGELRASRAAEPIPD